MKKISENSYKIALIDSGIGGISILQRLIEDYPESAFTYYFDHKNFPYGTKTETQVIDYVVEASQWLVARTNPDILVIACNTASTVALPDLRAKLSLPVVGVVPAIKVAAQKTKTGQIALIATQATVKRNYIDELVNEHASECQLLRLATQDLVRIAEEKMLGVEVDGELIRNELRPLFQDAQYRFIDTVVLGCTHFSFLLDEFKRLSPREIEWIDSVEAISRRVGQIMAQLSTQRPQHVQQGNPTRAFITSKELPSHQMTHITRILPSFDISTRQ